MKKKILVISLLALFWLLLCAFALKNEESFELDTEAHPFYRFVTTDELINDAKDNSDAVKEKYAGKYVLISGTIIQKSKNGDQLILKANTSDVVVVCNTKKIKEVVNKEAKVNGKVALYGKLRTDFFSKEVHEDLIDKQLHIDNIDKMISSPSNITSEDMWFTCENALSYDFTNLEEEKITVSSGNNSANEWARMKYYVTPSMAKNRHDIREEELGIIYGYQYVLNEADQPTEQLFVCYFDNDLLLDSEKKKADTKDVIKLIVENISNKSESVLVKKPQYLTSFYSSYYGPKYKLYRAKMSEPGYTGFRTEYAFQEDEDRGIVLFLYLYDNTVKPENRHGYDALLAMRFAELLYEE